MGLRPERRKFARLPNVAVQVEDDAMAECQAAMAWADALFAEWDATTSQPGRRTTGQSLRPERDVERSLDDINGASMPNDADMNHDDGADRHESPKADSLLVGAL